MRSVYCGHVEPSHIDSEVVLCGWVDRRRDHGGVIFIDLRDREGIVQVVVDPDAGEHFATADRVRGEYVLRIEGLVRAHGSDSESRDEDRHAGSLCPLGGNPQCRENATFPAGRTYQSG